MRFPWVYHAIVWSALLLLELLTLIAIYEPEIEWGSILLRTFGYRSVSAALFYLHYLLLIPMLLQANKNIAYLLSSIISLVASTYCFIGLYLILYHTTLDEVGLGQFLYFLVDALVMLGLANLTAYAEKGVFARQRESQLMQENLKNELAFLKTQINPHFLFNTLNSIYALARRQSGDTGEAILKLASIMRYVMNSSNQNSVPLEEELEQCEAFIELMRLRVGEDYDLTFEKKDVNEFMRTVPLSIMPVVENAFKHGDLSDNGFIHVSCYCTQSSFVLKLRNKIGKTREQHSGSGLTNLKRRLELSKAFTYTMNNSSTPEVYEITLKLTPID